MERRGVATVQIRPRLQAWLAFTWRASGLFCQPPGPIWPSSRAGFSFSEPTCQAQRVKTQT
eukprot:scaffold119113_cov45-Phaeocystis_antarctica.AAC.1